MANKYERYMYKQLLNGKIESYHDSYVLDYFEIRKVYHRHPDPQADFQKMIRKFCETGSWERNYTIFAVPIDKSEWPRWVRMMDDMDREEEMKRKTDAKTYIWEHCLDQ